MDKQRTLPLWAILLLFLNTTSGSLVTAGPVGGQVVGGSGSINQSGLNTTINQTSQNMAIDWQSYNLNANERVQYLQPNSLSISLNRILSQNGSTIAGRIDANGQVILVNPNGIFFTPTSIINVGGIIASGLNIQPTDFMNGNYIFDEVLGTDGTVINSGIINASLGGNVALIGKQVNNDGLITANLGTVSLAAGKQAVLTFDQGGLLGVRISEEILQEELGVDPAVLNSGQINAQGGRVLLTASTSQDVFSQAMNTGSLSQAVSVVLHEDGSFTLGDGADVLNSGSIDTSTVGNTQNVGRIVLIGENVTSSGGLYANATSGNGGEIELHAQSTVLLTENSLTSARSETDGQGGIIKVLGNRVGLFGQSRVDVSGANGGGQALIGGDYLGGNANIRNATTTVVGRETVLAADALQQGDGGRVILWADQNTYFWGDITVRGGALSGNGGFVETSGKENLLFDGNVDLSASNGDNGLLLLDPRDITIVSGNANQNTGNNNELILPNDLNVFFDDGDGLDFDITANRIELILVSGNVQLEARRDIDIDIDADINISSNTNNLTLLAGDDITVNSSVNIDSGDLLMVAGSASCQENCGTGGGGGGNIDGRNIYVNGRLDTTGNIDLYAADHVILDQGIGDTLQPNSVTIRAGDSILVNAINNGNSIEPNGSSDKGRITSSGTISLTASDAELDTINTTSGTVTTAITVSPTNTAVVGSIIIEGNVTTSNSDFTAITTTGYFNNLFNNQNLNTGMGAVTIQTGGTGTLDVDGSSVTAGAFLGHVTADTLSVSTMGSIIQSTTAESQNLVITDEASFNAGSNPINLLNNSNNLQGRISLITTGSNDVILNNGAAITILGTTENGALNVGGMLTVNAEQSLTLVNNITVGNTAQLNFAQNGNDGHIFTTSPGLDFTANTTVAGGDGNDIFNITANMAGQVNGNNGNDNFLMGASGSIVQIDGGAGTNTLTGRNANNTWTITSTENRLGISNGNTYVTTFTNINTLTGGTGNDTFTITNGSGPGSINGVFNGTFEGGAGINTLIASDTDNTWTINTTDSTLGYNDSNSNPVTSTFNAIQNISGGSLGDTLTVNADINNINMGNGNNRITVNSSGNVTGTLTGGTGIDLITVSGNISGVIDGGNNSSGNDTLTINAINDRIVQLGNAVLDSGEDYTVTNIEVINATTTNNTVGNTLRADASNNIWQVNADNGGTVSGISFSNFANLEGNTGTDDFTINAAIGTINAGNGGNRITVNSDGNIIGTLTGGTGIDTIEIIGSATTISSGDNNDLITVSGNVSGVIDGGNNSGGNDVLTIDVTNDRIIQLGNAVLDNGEDYTVTNIEVINATTTNNIVGNTLRADASNNIWQVNADNGGTVSGISFSNFANLEGNIGIDDFTINAAIGTINAGNGGNRITVNSDGNIIGTLTGGTGIDTIEIIGSATTISSGGNNDLITVSGNVSGVIDGGNNSGGNDVLTINVTNDRIIQLGNAVLDNGEDYTVTNIEVINATTTNNIVGNILRADANTNIWLVNADNGGTVSGVSFSNFANLEGNAGTDDFTVNAAIRSINAGNGNNTITVNGGGSVSDAITGGTGVDVIGISGSANTISTGNGNDRITVSGTVTGVIDGGAGSDDRFLVMGAGDQIVQLGNNDLNNGENYTAWNIETIDARGTTGNTIGNILRADTGNNDWTIDGINSGEIYNVASTTTTVFLNFANLTGNTATDAFTIKAPSGSLTGLMNGQDGNDSLNIVTEGNVTVQLGSMVDDNLNVFQVEAITANGQNTNTLIGNNVSDPENPVDYTWRITGNNSGNVTGNNESTTFTHFNNLYGGTAVDKFTVTPTGAIGLIDMGAGNDFFTINGNSNAVGTAQTVDGNSGDDTFTVSGGNVIKMIGGDDIDTIVDTSAVVNITVGVDVGGFEGITAQNGLGIINAQDNVQSDWLINGANTGSVSVNGNTNQNLAFSGFSTINGGSGTDNFTVNGNGSISGIVHGGGGNDTLLIDLPGNTDRRAPGQIYFDGSDGTDMVTIMGASDVYREIYNPDTHVNDNNYDQLRYINNENASIIFDVNYQQTETVNDNIQTTSLTINSAGDIGNAGAIILGTNTFGFGTDNDVVMVNYQADRQTDIIVQVLNGSDLNLVDNITVNGDLTITANKINQANSTSISASRLSLDGTNQTEITTNSLTTNVDELAIINHNGAIVINEQNGIVLIDISNTTGSIDITTAAGDITSAARLITSGTLNLNAGNNDIALLSDKNQLSGELTLSGSSITINTTTATTLAGVTAQNLSITSTGSITDADAFSLQIDNTAVLTSDGDIILDNDSNNFDIVELNAKGDAILIESNGITLTNTTVDGTLSVTANNGLAANEISIDNNMALGNITAATIDLNANEGAIVSQSSDLTVTADTITLTAASGIGIGGNDGSGGSDAESIRGAINTSTSTLSVINASFEGADERSGADNVNVMATSGTININNTGDVIINDLRNNGNITLTNAGNITLNVTDSSGAIDANYGGNLSDSRYAGDVTLSARGNNISTLGVGTRSDNVDIIAESLYVRNVSRFGTQASPIGLRVNTQFTLLFTNQGTVYYLGRRPEVTTTADLLELAIRGFIGISSQQLIDVENLGEIDQAIFTEVRNYNYDDIAIRLPADQNYDDDEEDEKENEEEKES